MTRTENEFSKVAGYKVSLQKSVAFLYTNEISERECKKKKKVPFKITHTPNKILRNKPDQGGEGFIG